MDSVETRIRNLGFWKGEIDIAPLGGGRTNLNFVIKDEFTKYVLRVGTDIPEHHVMRFNEIAASRAAHAAGISPTVQYSKDGMTILSYIECKTLDEPDVRNPAYLERIIPLMKSCHHNVPNYLRGPVLMFWVFHVIRDYAATLRQHHSPYVNRLDDFLKIARQLEKAVGKVEIVFGHNDFMAANILDDGARLWLIDWDYAGFNSPLFDLGGLASNNGLDGDCERWMLENYFETLAPDDLLHRYYAMKCASLLRETMWSMVSESISDLDIDYAAYTAENLTRFTRAFETYQQS